MIRIGKGEVVFSTSFITHPGESALIAPQESQTFNLRLNAVDKEVKADDPNHGIEIAVNGIEFAITVPFLRNGASTSVEMRDYAKTSDGALVFRLALQSVGIAMLVHADIHFERNAA